MGSVLPLKATGVLPEGVGQHASPSMSCQPKIENGGVAAGGGATRRSLPELPKTKSPAASFIRATPSPKG